MWRMKQVTQNFKTGVLSVVDVPQPALRAGCVLVRNEWSAVSAGTERTKVEFAGMSVLGKARARPDLVQQVLHQVRTQGVAVTYEKVRTRLDTLAPLGYSSAGTVLGVFADVRGLRVGQRVACAGEAAAHAEVVCVPRNLCVALRDGVSTEHAAYTTLGAIALQGIRQADVRLGERVLVIGLGLIGQLAVQMLRAGGCQVAGADVSARQMLLADASGCGLVVDASDATAEARLDAWTSGAGFDAVIITAAAQDNAPFLLAANVARDRARIVLVGVARIDLPRAPFYEKELSVVMSRSYGPGRYDPAYEEHGHDYPIGYVRWTEQRNMDAFVEMLGAGSVSLDHLTTHRFDVDEAVKAYDLLATGAEPYTGILLRYPERAQGSSAHVATAEIGTGRRGVVLVGAGSFASRVLVPALKAAGELELDAVVSASGLSAADTAAKSGFRAAESDPEVAFRRPGVGAAVIATRHDSHAHLAQAAMRAGLDVFVEKPLCITPDELGSVVRAQRESGRMCVVGFNRRFAPATRVLQNLRRRAPGPVQCLVRVNAGKVPITSWIQDPGVGGGRIVGEVCHFVDLAAAVTESPISRVHALCLGVAASPETADSISVHLTHADESVSTLVYTAEGDTRLPKEYVELYAAGAVAVVDDFRLVRVFEHGGVRISRSRGQDKGHSAEVAAFSRAVSKSESIEELSFDDCVDSTVATFAVIESLRTGLPIDVLSFRASIQMQ
jgi:predicted dehydrogenase/threonine dehydrogenase-like Zn-dependent dehydrogenase